jgi:hypothetical protein
MSIIRREVRLRFTTIDNGLIEDTRLSPEELGLMVYLLSKPNNWTARPSELMKRFDMGKDKCYRIIKDLIEKGWLVRREIRQSGGEFSSYEYIVMEENPCPGNPDAVKPDAVNPDTNKDLERTKTEREQKSMAASPPKAGPHSAALLVSGGSAPCPPVLSGREFLEFWDAYGRKTKRPDAEKSYWRARKKVDHLLIMAGARRWAMVEEQFRPYPATWLNNEMWNDQPPVQTERKMTNGERNQRRFREAMARVYEANVGSLNGSSGGANQPHSAGSHRDGYENARLLPPPRR